MIWSSLEGLFIGGRYEISQHIATGGMAVVFRGWDHRMERPVAIKMLRQLEHADQYATARFRREAHAAAMLDHPNVVRAYDFFEENGCYYLVMEFIEGLNLKQRLRRIGPLPADEALSIADQVCTALMVAHAHGFIHRDIKPQNIMLDAQGVAKVADFGIVHITRGGTLSCDGAVLGTADYIAPEQARGETLTPATDVYALGVVLYEMLTGRLPFTGATPMAVATQHATRAPQPPRELVPTLSPYVEAVVMRALRKEPGCRYTSAGAMRLAVRLAHQALLEPPDDAAQLNAEVPTPSEAPTAAQEEPAPVPVGVAAPVKADPPTASGAARAATAVARDASAVRAAGGSAAEPEADPPGEHWSDLAAALLAPATGAPEQSAAEWATAGDAALAHEQVLALDGAMVERALPAVWTRVLVIAVVLLVLVGATAVLQLWLGTHGGGSTLILPPLH